MFEHPRREEIDAFQAGRLCCSPTALRSGGATVVRRARAPSRIDVFETQGGTVVTTDEHPAAALSAVVADLRSSERTTATALIESGNGTVLRHGSSDLHLYLDPGRLQTAAAAGVRALRAGDAPRLRELQASLPENQRWFVEIDHAGLYGCVREGKVVSAASHLPEKGCRVTDLGVITHPRSRRRGFGKAVVSAAIAWALDRDLICQWVTTDRNRASLALARSLGFELYGTETELEVADPG